MRAREEWLDAVDKLAAEKVRGWTWREYTAFGIPAMGLFPPPPSGSFRDRDRYGSPTRSISDAWELVEAMEQRGLGLTLYTPGAYTDEGLGPCDRHTAVFASEHDIGEHTCDSTPLAIVLAALDVVGAEIPEEPTRE